MHFTNSVSFAAIGGCGRGAEENSKQRGGRGKGSDMGGGSERNGRRPPMPISLTASATFAAIGAGVGSIGAVWKHLNGRRSAALRQSAALSVRSSIQAVNASRVASSSAKQIQIVTLHSSMGEVLCVQECPSGQGYDLKFQNFTGCSLRRVDDSMQLASMAECSKASTDGSVQAHALEPSSMFMLIPDERNPSSYMLISMGACDQSLASRSDSVQPLQLASVKAMDYTASSPEQLWELDGTEIVSARWPDKVRLNVRSPCTVSSEVLQQLQQSSANLSEELLNEAAASKAKEAGLQGLVNVLKSAHMQELSQLKHRLATSAGEAATAVQNAEALQQELQMMHQSKGEQASNLAITNQALKQAYTRLCTVEGELRQATGLLAHKDDQVEFAEGKVLKLEAALQAITERVDIIMEERHLEPQVHASLKMVDLATLRERLSRMELDLSSSMTPPLAEHGATGGVLSPAGQETACSEAADGLTTGVSAQGRPGHGQTGGMAESGAAVTRTPSSRSSKCCSVTGATSLTVPLLSVDALMAQVLRESSQDSALDELWRQQMQVMGTSGENPSAQVHRLAHAASDLLHSSSLARQSGRSQDSMCAEVRDTDDVHSVDPPFSELSSAAGGEFLGSVPPVRTSCLMTSFGGAASASVENQADVPPCTEEHHHAAAVQQQDNSHAAGLSCVISRGMPVSNVSPSVQHGRATAHGRTYSEISDVDVGEMDEGLSPGAMHPPNMLLTGLGQMMFPNNRRSLRSQFDSSDDDNDDDEEEEERDARVRRDQTQMQPVATAQKQERKEHPLLQRFSVFEMGDGSETDEHGQSVTCVESDQQWQQRGREGQSCCAEAAAPAAASRDTTALHESSVAANGFDVLSRSSVNSCTAHCTASDDEATVPEAAKNSLFVGNKVAAVIAALNAAQWGQSGGGAAEAPPPRRYS